MIINNVLFFVDKHISVSAIIAIPGIIAALLIPIATFIIGDEKNDDIDKDIITNKIFLAKVYIPFFMLGSLSLLAVDWMRFLPSIYVIFLIIFTMNVLFRVYKWISVKEFEDKNNEYNYKQKLRYEYYTSQKNDFDRIRIWKIVLQNIGDKNQSNIITALIDTLEQMDSGAVYEANQDKIINLLLAEFDKIRFADLDEFKKIIRFALKYYYDLEINRRDDSGRSRSPACAKKELLNRLLEFSISKGNNSYNTYEHIFFQEIDNIEENEIDYVFFLTNILGSLRSACVKYEKTVNTILDNNYFFKRIEVLQNNTLTGKDYKVIDAYFVVTRNDIICNDIKGRDAIVVDRITEKIFQDVDLITWFVFYTFIYNRYQYLEDKDEYYSKVVSWCNEQREVGMFGRMDSSIIDIDRDNFKNNKDEQDYVMREFARRSEYEQENAMNMASLVFSQYNNIEYIDNILIAIKKIKHDKYFNNGVDDIRNYRLLKLEKTFKKYKKYLIGKEKKNV